MSGGKSSPPPPDYTGAAREQSAASRNITEQQTWANRPNINTPFGQQTWSNTPTWDATTGQWLNQWTQNTNLTPESQAALDSQMRLQQGRSELGEDLMDDVGSSLRNPMDWSQFQQLADTPQANTYGEGLDPFSSLPDVPTYDRNQLPGQGQAPGQNQYSPEQIQRGLDTSGLQGVDPSQRYQQNAEDAIYGQWENRMNPQFEEDTNRLRTQLYNSGLKEGDEAYDREMQKLRQSQGDARTNAQFQATIGSGQEASRMHGMDLSTRGQQFGETATGGAFANSAADQALRQQLGIGGQQFGEGMQLANLSDTQRQNALNEQLGIGAQQFSQEAAVAGMGDQRRQQQAQEQLAFGQNRFAEGMQGAEYQNRVRQQQIAEEAQRRGISLNEMNALLSGQQVGLPGTPSFTSAQGAASPNLLGAAGMQGQAMNDQFSANQAQTQGNIQGLASLAMMFSDRRLKSDITPVFKYKGHQIYSYQGPDGFDIGVMADEVPSEFVVRHSSGYDMVNYGRLIQ